MQMGHLMKVSGMQTTRVVLGSRLGQTGPFTMDHIKTAKRMVKEHLSKLTVANIKENLRIMKSLDMVSTNGPMEEYMRVTGKQT